MASASLWAAVAGAAQGVGSVLERRQKTEEAERLKQLQEDAALKRDLFLKKYAAQLDEEAAEKKHEREKGDVVSNFTAQDSGKVFGRTKGGQTIPLYEPDAAYSKSIVEKNQTDAQLKAAQLANAQNQPAMDAARLREMAAQTDRALRPDKTPDPRDAMADKIRDNYTRMREDLAKAPTPDLMGDNGQLDMNLLDEKVKAQLYPVFGGENVKASLGGNAGRERTAGAPQARSTPPQQQSPSQPQAPTPDKIMADANAKAQQIAQIADPAARQAAQAKLDAAVQAMFQQYGYQPK